MSSGPYLCFREVLPASAISCSAFFTKITTDEYLCTGCTNNINIYKIVRLLDTTPCLSHVAHFPLNGTVRDIAIVTQCDEVGVPEQLLLISCDAAKFALLQFDHINNKLHIVRMHNAEVDAIGTSAVVKADVDGRLQHPGVGDVPLTRIDARNNIACSVLYAYQLLFLPFDVFGLPERKPFVCNVATMGLPGAILDMCVLHDAVETTIAILQEAEPLPIGHLAKTRNTCVVTVLRVDIFAGKCAVVWRKEKLPHDTLRIYPIQHPAFPHSLFIVSLNAIFVANHREIRGLAMNGFAKVSVAEDIMMQACPLQTLGIELRASRWCELPRATFLGTLTDGSLLMIKLLSTSELVWSELRFFMDFVGKTPSACDVITNTVKNLLFLPSIIGDALLCELDIAFDLKDSTVSTNLFGPVSKRSRRNSLLRTNGSLELTGAMVEEEVAFYGAPLSTMSLLVDDVCGTVQLSLRVVDKIAVMGPVLNSLITSFDVSTCQIDAISRETTSQSLYATAASYIADREARNSLFVAAGMKAASALHRVSFGVPFMKIATRNFGEAVSVSVLNDDINVVAYLILSYEDHVRIIKASENVHQHGGQGQLVLTEVSIADTSFVNDRTLMMGYLRDSLAVQVYPGGLRLLNMKDGVAVQDVVAEEDLEMGGLGCAEGEVIVSGDCGNDYVTLLTSRKIVYVLKYELDMGMLMMVCSTVSMGMEIMCMSLYCGPFPTCASRVSIEANGVTPEDCYFYGAESYHCIVHDPPPAQHVDLLVVCSNIGQVYFYDIPSMVCRFVSASVGAMPMSLPNILNTETELLQTKKYAVAVKFCRVGKNGAPEDLWQYCLSIALNSGDVLVYYTPDREAFHLVKLHHTIVTRRRNHKKWKKFNVSEFSMYQYENTATTMRLAADIDGHTVLAISSNPPVIVSCNRGLLTVQSLCLPELPLIGNGTYIATYLSVGQLRCISMLWREDVPATDSTPRRYSSILGLYRETAGVTLYPGSVAVSRRMSIGTTTHKVLELFGQKTNDKIQQALLKKKTFILSCSEVRREKFNPKVLSPEAAEEDRSNYDRFFLKMESFHENPTNDLGAPPGIDVHCHKLQVMQNNTIVDVFDLKPGEKVLDIDSVYLNIGENKTKLFIVACTVIDDKHGEDTQGEGRLLLFTLDYALYETVDVATSHEAPDTAKQSSAQTKFLDSIQPKLRFLWAGPGPGTIVKQFGDKYVLASVGPQLYVYRLNAETMEMDQVAFFYAQVRISQV